MNTSKTLSVFLNPRLLFKPPGLKSERINDRGGCFVKLKKQCALILVSIAMLGCQKMSPTQFALNQADAGKIDKSSGRPACEIQAAEYTLDAKMVAFDLTDSAGVHAGFDLISGFLKLFSIDFHATTGRMAMSMSLYDPMTPKVELLGVLGSSISLNFGVAVDVGFQNIGAGFNLSHQTPLATLVQNSLNDTFTNLTTQMNDLQEAWHTEVVAVPTKDAVIIPVGSFANLKVGDQFAIFNVDHVWSGKPCESEHLIARKSPLARVAVGEITQIANNAAVLTLLDTEANPRMNGVTILQGSAVEIFNLTDAARVPYRLMQIRNVVGAQIAYDNAQKVDVSQPLKDQISALAHNFGFMNYMP